MVSMLTEDLPTAHLLDVQWMLTIIPLVKLVYVINDPHLYVAA